MDATGEIHILLSPYGHEVRAPSSRGRAAAAAAARRVMAMVIVFIIKGSVLSIPWFALFVRLIRCPLRPLREFRGGLVAPSVRARPLGLACCSVHLYHVWLFPCRAAA